MIAMLDDGDAQRPQVDAVGNAAPSASSLGTSSPGSLPVSVNPNRSLIWLAKMMTAMPAVKPTVTG